MAVRSKRLAAGSTNAGPTSIYTCPAGFRTIVKSIISRNAGGAAGAMVFTLRVGGVDVAVFSLWATASGTNGDSVVSAPWLVLEAGDVLRISYPSASGGWYMVSGAELLL